MLDPRTIALAATVMTTVVGVGAAETLTAGDVTLELPLGLQARWPATTRR